MLLFSKKETWRFLFLKLFFLMPGATFFFPLKHYCYDVLNIIPGKSCISLGILFFFFFNRSMLGFWVRFVILVEKSWDQWNGLYTPAKTHFFRVWKSPCFGRCHSPRTERRLSSNDVMFYPQQKKSTCVTTFAPLPAPLKGQLVSECLFDIFVFSIKLTKNFTNFCPRI